MNLSVATVFIRLGFTSLCYLWVYQYQSVSIDFDHISRQEDETGTTSLQTEIIQNLATFELNRCLKFKLKNTIALPSSLLLLPQIFRLFDTKM